MSQELFYTSAPKGLKPGSKGFCTVAATAGMSAPLAERLESLSGYRPIFAPGSTGATKNPVIFAHWRVTVGGRIQSVLSRVCFAGFDYTQRSNKFAHHIVLDPSEQTPAGPAWVMMQQGIMANQWVEEPRVIPTGRVIPSGENPVRVCQAWMDATGDAGWAGALAEAFLLDASKPSYIIFSPGTDLLSLLNEAIALLPPKVLWQVTFSTYFTDLPAGTSCAWRCCVAGTPAAKEAGRIGSTGLVVDLTKPTVLKHDSRYIQAARSGVMAAPISPAPTANGEVAETGTESALAAASPDVRGYGLRRRLVGAGVGANDRRSEEPADQSWMPPSPSASIEDIKDAPRRPLVSVIFWGVAIIWPLIVLVIGGFLLRGRSSLSGSISVERNGPTTNPSIEIEKLQTEILKLTEATRATTQANESLKKDNKFLTEQIRDIKPKDNGQGMATTPPQETQGQQTEAETKPGVATLPSPAPTTPPNYVVPNYTLPIHATWPVYPIANTGLFRKDETNIAELPKDITKAKIEISPPELWGKVISRTDNGNLFGEVVDTFDKKKEIPLISIYGKERNLVWKWQEDYRSKFADAEYKRLEALLKASVITVELDDSTKILAQFVEPKSLDLSVSEKCPLDLDPAGGRLVGLRVISCSSNFSPKNTKKNQSIEFKSANASFFVELDSSTKQLCVLWEKASNEESIKLQEAINSESKLNQEQTNNKSDGENEKKIKAARDAARDKVTAAYTTIAELKSFKELIVVVELENGLILYKITVKRP